MAKEKVKTVHPNQTQGTKRSYEPKDQYPSQKEVAFIAGGIIGAGITALLMQNCDYNSNSHTGEKSSQYQGAPPSTSSMVYMNKEDLENQFRENCDLSKRLDQCEDDLEACLEENKELSKRPKYCPKVQLQYKPTECPQTPYIRKGD